MDGGIHTTKVEVKIGKILLSWQQG